MAQSVFPHREKVGLYDPSYEHDACDNDVEGIDNPLQVCIGRVKCIADARHCHVHDGCIDSLYPYCEADEC